MKVTFLTPSTKRAIGGNIALYQFANGLSRRGHEVHIVHAPVIDDHIEKLADLSWFRFEPNIGQHLVRTLDVTQLPDSDFIDLTALEYFVGSDQQSGPTEPPPSAGLPFLFVQALGIFPSAIEERAFRTRWPKICIARWLVDALQDMGLPQQQVNYVPYGLDHEMFRLVRPIEHRGQRVSMLYNEHPAKGARIGIAAIQEVRRRIPGLRATIFSSQDPVLSIPTDISFVKLPPPHLLVDEIYNESRVFVCASISEGFGFCAIEAMACGCALVTTDNGGSDDYARDHETALVCAPRDVEALADRIETLLRDDLLCARIASRGREFVRRFDWDDSARQLETFLESYGSHPEAYRSTAA